MILATAALAAGFASAIDGSNIVGYGNANFTYSTGAKLITPFFLSTDQTSKIRLSDIKVTGYEENEESCGEVWIDELDEVGRTKQVDDGEGGKINVRYVWWDKPTGPVWDPPKAAGWYDINDTPLKDGESPLGNANEILITAGDSFYAYGTGDWQAKFQVAGAVNANKLVMEFPYSTGAKALGNAFPTARHLSDFYVTGYEENEESCGEVWIDELDEVGRTKQVDDGEGGKINVRYVWWDKPTGPVWDPPKAAGWYDANENPLKDGESPLGNANEIVVQPGDGFWAYGTSDWQAYLNVNKLDLDINKDVE